MARKLTVVAVTVATAVVASLAAAPPALAHSCGHWADPPDQNVGARSIRGVGHFQCFGGPTGAVSYTICLQKQEFGNWNDLTCSSATLTTDGPHYVYSGTSYCDFFGGDEAFRSAMRITHHEQSPWSYSSVVYC